MRVVQSWSFCTGMESLKLLFLALGLLLRKAPERISTPVSTGECKCPHSAGACTDGRGWRTQEVSDHPCEFPEWLCELDNGAVSCMNGQQTVSNCVSWVLMAVSYLSCIFALWHRMTTYKVNRFEKVFNFTSGKLITRKGIKWVYFFFSNEIVWECFT